MVTPRQSLSPPLEVVILTIDNGAALTRDRFGKDRPVSLGALHSTAPLPREGETWIIDKSSGYWNFDRAVRSNLPVLNSDGTTDDLLRQLISILVADGYITDESPPSSSVPTGAIMPYVAVTPPLGWLVCDGSAILRADYPELHAVLKDANGIDSYPYGSGDGLTTFNLPDLRGRVPVGRDSTGQHIAAAAAALGLSGGVETVALTVAQMPSHTHVQNSHSHTHDPHNHTQNSHTHTQNSHSHTIDPHTHDVGGTGLNLTDSSGGNTSYAVQNGTFYTFRTNGIVSATATMQSATATNQSTTATNVSATSTGQATAATSQNTGGGGAHQNLQPFLTVRYIVKA